MTRLTFYKEIILPTLLYGVECWYPSPESLKRLESWQYGMLLRIAGRKRLDHIAAVDVYRWTNQTRINILPIAVLMSRRRLIYHATIRRNTKNIIPSQVFWGDIVTPHQYINHRFMEESQLLKDLKNLGISTRDANLYFKSSVDWEEIVGDGTIQGVANWIDNKRKDLQNRRRRRQPELGDYVELGTYRKLPCIRDHHRCQASEDGCLHYWGTEVRYKAQGAGRWIMEDDTGNE
jgi:hypothetical protein